MGVTQDSEYPPKRCHCLSSVSYILELLSFSDFLIDSELTVKPGTPLTMTIALDRKSSDIYGVMVSNMEVTDTRSQEEILILNG